MKRRRTSEAESLEARRAEARVSGMCHTCVTRRASPDRTTCRSCRKRAQESAAARYYRLRAEGRCVICQSPSRGYTYCAADRELQNQRQRELYVRRKKEAARAVRRKRSAT